MSIPSVADEKTPEPTGEDIRTALRDAFGIVGEPLRLEGEHDLNFRVDGNDGPCVAKVSRVAPDNVVAAFRHSMLAHIHRVDPDLRIPRPIAAANGDEAVPVGADGHGWELRVFTFVPGSPLRETSRSLRQLEAVGRFMGRLSKATRGFGHPGAHRQDHPWNLDRADGCLALLDYIEPRDTRAMVERVLDRWQRRVKPSLVELPAAVVHHDANDDNLLVDDSAGGGMHIGLIDFGDAVFARRINELAVTLAYALMDVDDISGAARAVIRGYTRELALTGQELSVLFDLIATRLAMSLCISFSRRVASPDNAYHQVSQRQAIELLGRLEAMNPRFATSLFRCAAGHPPVQSHDAVVSWLSENADAFASVFPFDLKAEPRIVVTLGRDDPGTEYATDPDAYERWLDERMRQAGAGYAIGLYGERREVYTTGQFESAASDQRRSVHLGIDLFVPAGTPLHAPLAGTVVSVQDNDMPLDYGPTVIIEHRCGEDGPPFWTLYGHLARSTLTMVAPGQRVEAGQPIGAIGDPAVNGGWTPHLHFQLITDLLGETGNFNGAGEPGNMDVWRAISPDPNLVLGLAPETFDTCPAPEELEQRRAALLGPSLSVSYRHKLEIVRGRGAWLYDQTGRAYLDCVNNICHVGHSHPRVVEALHAQAAKLNTNTRYLHENIVEYAERLLATFPDPLSVCYFVCSGSEANELALRLARTYTGREDMLVLDWAYHGNSGALVDLSPYKFKRAGGRGRAPHVHIAGLPDPYRGPHKGRGEATAMAYALDVDRVIEACRERTGHGPAAMIAESMAGCGGQIVYPERYLHHAFERVRTAGGVCIADEVQTGFGRVGDAMWAFELQDTVPDIVTLGKPIGNGHPMAAVVTTPEIAEAFANGMEYFNSFGGNPVSCAVGLSVLDVIEDEGLQESARVTGNDLLARLEDMAHRHPIIGDVRGRGMFIGIELVTDRDTLEPATETADHVVNLLREQGVLLSTDGPYDNVLKFKPPLALGAAEADYFCRKLDAALGSASGAGDR